MVAAQTLADVAAAYILNAKARDVARVTSDAFRHSALHDPLTGLPNRLLLQQRLEHAAQRAKRSKTYAAILFADLDRFKRINDTYGHPVGDELLVAVAHRLSALVRPGDTLARFSGDEFVFLCEELRRPADAELLAKRVEDAFSAPFMLGKIEVVLTASVGIAYGGHGEDVSGDLVSRADIAMYQAKRKGGASHQIIDLTEASKSIDRDNLEFDLRAAFGQDELELAYQPVMNSDDGITGVEALLRWTHPERGAIPAVTMIAIAEQSGLIVKIGSWVLERGCRDRCDWLRDHPGHPLDLAVNISARQLMSPDFLQTVRSILAGTGMDPTALIIEITENIFIEDGDHAMEVLSELQRLGIRFALDDPQNRPEFRRAHPRHHQKRRDRRRRHQPRSRSRAQSDRRGRRNPDATRCPAADRLRISSRVFLRATDDCICDRRRPCRPSRQGQGGHRRVIGIS
jgi:diguanylate cyclase (GGDEF)-like protein